MHSWSDTLRFAFQPVVNLTTGGVAALEILARPEAGDVLAEARRDPEVDGRLAALRDAVREAGRLPWEVTVEVVPLRARAVRLPAGRLGDPPRTVGVDATAWEVLDVVAVGDRDRTSDDVAVVDRAGGAWASYGRRICCGRSRRAGSRRRRGSIR